MRIATFLLSAGLVAASITLGAQSQTAGPAPGESLSQSYRGSQSNNVEYQKVAPIKVFDNLYYVGPGSVSVWLIGAPVTGRCPNAWRWRLRQPHVHQVLASDNLVSLASSNPTPLRPVAKAASASDRCQVGPGVEQCHWRNS